MLQDRFGVYRCIRAVIHTARIDVVTPFESSLISTHICPSSEGIDALLAMWSTDLIEVIGIST
jgi:hypothetical protein